MTKVKSFLQSQCIYELCNSFFLTNFLKKDTALKNEVVTFKKKRKKEKRNKQSKKIKKSQMKDSLKMCSPPIRDPCCTKKLFF